MIPQRLRLARQRIEYLFRKGRKTTSDFLTIRYSPVKQENHSRYCVIISKATEKSAVKRNHLRRQIYEILRTYEQNENSENKSKFEMAIICKKKLRNLDYNYLKAKINDLLNKLPR
jgi:ribonuclease P protein component